MKKISSWASTHRNPARFLIVCIKLMLAVMACYWGILLSNANIILPGMLIYAAAFLILIAAFIFYPSKKNTSFSKTANYTLRKSFDFMLGACSFLVIASMANNRESIVSPVSNVFAAIGKRAPTAEEILTALKTGEKKELTRKEKRILKKEFFKQVKLYAVNKASGNKDKASEAGLIILTIIGALGLLYLLAALACSISCSGSEALAIIVALLGLAGIIWATVAIIRRIKHGPKNKAPAKTE